MQWAREIRAAGGKTFATAWDETKPRTTPDGLADPKGAAAALERAAREVESRLGSLDAPWGDVARLRIGTRDYPGHGGGGELGIFRVVGYAPDKDQRYRAIEGDSYVAAIEFTTPVRARVLLSYGNSSQPGSAHNGDQLELFARKQLREALLTRRAVEAALESKEVVDYR